MLFYGPYLRYVGTIADGDDSFWTGSAMVVAPSDVPVPVLTLSTSDEPEGVVIEASLIHSAATHHFYRFPLRLPLKGHHQCCSYVISGLPSVFDFHLPAADDQYWRCAFTSCNGFSNDVPEATVKEMGGIRPLWDDMLRKHEQKPYYVMMGGGDQLYCDDVWNLDSLREWLHIKGKENRLNAPWTERMDQEVDEFYFTTYCSHFASDGLNEAYAKIPQINVADDHDVFDGFGSYPEYLEKSNVFLNLRRIGYKYFLLFQHQTIAESERKKMFLENSNSYSVLTTLGKSMAALMLDTRHQRSREHIVRKEEWEATFAALETLSPQIRHLLVVFGVPIVYPRLDSVDSTLTFVNSAKRGTNRAYNKTTNKLSHGLGKVMGDRVEEKLKRSADHLKKALGKSGRMKALLNQFGEVSLLDDLIDHWTHEFHQEERATFIARLQKLSAARNIRVTFLAGDVHCAGVGRLFNPHDEIDNRLMYQVISSAIVNAPPPSTVLKVLHRNCSKRNAKPTRFGDDNVETHEEMVEVFEKDVDGKSAPEAGTKLMGRRNWCSIEQGEYGSDVLEFKIMVENEDWRLDSVPYGVEVPPM